MFFIIAKSRELQLPAPYVFWAVLETCVIPLALDPSALETGWLIEQGVEMPSLTCPLPIIVVFLEPQEGALLLFDQVAVSREAPELVFAFEEEPVEHVLYLLGPNGGSDYEGGLLLEELEGVVLLGGIGQFLQSVHPGAELLDPPFIQSWLIVNFLYLLILWRLSRMTVVLAEVKYLFGNYKK